ANKEEEQKLTQTQNMTYTVCHVAKDCPRLSGWLLFTFHISLIRYTSISGSRSESKERRFSTFSSCINSVTRSDMFSDFTK
ncbi:MAG: hypothetical protein LGB62_07355, partial [Sulfurovum sp.]|nr:hypothetical protein [Sulfurovum sp.]